MKPEAGSSVAVDADAGATGVPNLLALVPSKIAVSSTVDNPRDFPEHLMDGKLETRHCINSKSKTYEGDQWVRVEVLVHGDELMRHYVEGEPVLEYTKPQIGGGNVSPVDPKVKVDGTPLTGGYISIQAETAPIDFRKIEILNLEGCKDQKAKTFKAYYVKDNPKACR